MTEKRKPFDPDHSNEIGNDDRMDTAFQELAEELLGVATEEEKRMIILAIQIAQGFFFKLESIAGSLEIMHRLAKDERMVLALEKIAYVMERDRG
jgi:hypothetical protein